MGAARSRANRRGRRPRRPRKTLRCRQQQLLPSPLGEGGPAGPDEGQAPAAVLPRVTTRGDSRCRQHPRRGQDPSLRTEPLTGAHANPRAGHARPLPCGGPGTGARVNPTAFPYPPSVGRGAPTPPRPPVAANNNPCLPPWGKVAPQGRMRGRLPLPPIPGQTVGGGVPDAPRNLAPTAIPRVTTRKHPPMQTCGPGIPGPYRAT